MAPSDAGNFFSGPVGMCVSAKAVYGWFKNGNPQVIDAGQDAWGKVSDLQAEIGTLINKAVTDSGATWSGAAGDSMRSSASPLSTWADLTGSSAASGSSAVAEIGSAYRDAQNSVQPPVEVPDKPWYNDFSPWDTDYDDAVEKSQGVDEANMRVINAYADRTNYAVSNMPTFEAPPDTTAEVDDETGPTPPGKIDYKPGEVDQNGNGKTDSSTGRTDTSIGSVISDPTRPPGTGDTDGSRTDQDTTRPSDTDDGITRPSDVNDPNRPPIGTPTRPPTGIPGGIDNPTGIVPFGPNDPRNPANRPGGPGQIGAGRGGGGGGAGGGRGGLGGGGLGSGAGAGAGGRGGMGLGPGGAAAAGQFGGSAGTSAGEGGRAGAGGYGPGGAAAGARGAAGAGAMGGAGAGARGEGGDDLEHSSKYLQPSDEYFGDGTMVAPPVIGG